MRNWLRYAEAGLSDCGWSATTLRLSGDPRIAAFRPKSLRAIRRARPDAIVYVPYSGLTRRAALRMAALRLARPKAITAIAVIQAAPGADGIRGKPKTDLGLFASARLARNHPGIARRQVILPPAVDTTKFQRPRRTKRDLRAALELPPGLPLVLHVGHLQSSRNLEVLAGVSERLAPRVSVLMVASTATEIHGPTLRMLTDAGVTVLRSFIPHIERVYQAADVYVFPVTDPQGSIELPLSVLEAVCCGTPVVATPFGGLPELASSGIDLHLVSCNEIGDTV